MVMPKRQTKMVSVNLYVSDVDFIDEEARKNDMNRSDVIRKTIRDHVEKKREEKENAWNITFLFFFPGKTGRWHTMQGISRKNKLTQKIISEKTRENKETRTLTVGFLILYTVNFSDFINYIP